MLHLSSNFTLQSDRLTAPAELKRSAFENDNAGETNITKLLVCSILALLFLAPLEGFGQERSEAPVFKDGDFWRYRVVEHGEYMKTERQLNGIYEVVFSDGRFRIFKLEEIKTIELQPETGLLVGLVGETEKLKQTQFLLYKGKSWNADYTFRPRRRNVDRLVNAVTRVTDFGDITIDFGTFPSFKIERELWFRKIDHWTHTYYWSPQTKSVLKYYMEVLKGAAAGSSREMELIKFGSTR
jgi:hypothetical protein